MRWRCCRHGAAFPKKLLEMSYMSFLWSTGPSSSRCANARNDTCIFSTTSCTLEPKLHMSRLRECTWLRCSKWDHRHYYSDKLDSKFDSEEWGENLASDCDSSWNWMPLYLSSKDADQDSVAIHIWFVAIFGRLEPVFAILPYGTKICRTCRIDRRQILLERYCL